MTEPTPSHLTTFYSQGSSIPMALGSFAGPLADVPYIGVGSDVAPVVFADLGNGTFVNMANVVRIDQIEITPEDPELTTAEAIAALEDDQEV